MNVLRINGVDLHYKATAAFPGAKTLVFINSLGTDFRIWDGVAAALTGRFNMLFHDKRGHGLSSLGDEPHDIATYAEDVRQLTVALGLSNIVLCGLSVGGLIAQHIMARDVPGLRGVILSNTALKIGDASSWNKRIADVMAGGTGAIADAVMERWFSGRFRTERQAELSLYRTMLSRSPADGYAACCAAIRDCDFSRSSCRSLPVLCIGGEEDGSTPPALVRAMASHIPEANYMEIAGAGHIPCVEQPEHYAGLVQAFTAAL